MGPIFFHETTLKDNKNKIKDGTSKKKMKTFKTVQQKTVRLKLKYSKHFNLLPLRKPVIHIINESKSKDYKTTLNTGTTQKFAYIFTQIVLKPTNHMLFAEAICIYVCQFDVQPPMKLSCQ